MAGLVDVGYIKTSGQGVNVDRPKPATRLEVEFEFEWIYLANGEALEVRHPPMFGAQRPE